MSEDPRKSEKIWPEVLVRHPPAAAEAVAHFLFESGACALLQEEIPGGAGAWLSRAGFDPDRPIGDLAQDLNDFLEDLAGIFGLNQAPRAEWQNTRHGNWAEKWKEGLAPLEIGPVLVVKPSWCLYQARPDQVVLVLDPGMAFGTGCHATTYMCLAALDEIIRTAGPRARRVLDIGTGSGILAMACAALGAGQITAIDIDAEALVVASENLERNGLVDRIRLICAGPAALKGEYDLILANLTAGPLMDLAPTLTRLAAPGAMMVLSGLLTDQARAVLDCYEELGLILERKMDQEEWTAVVLTRTMKR